MIKLFFVFIFPAILLAQNIATNIYFIADTIEQNSSSTSLAKPINGWKAFYDKIVYPIYAYNNNMESSFDLTINIDVNGNVKKIDAYGNKDRTVFLNSVTDDIFETKWSPATLNNKKTESKITFQFLFYIKRYDNPFPLVIEGNQASVRNTSVYNDLTKDHYSKVDTLIKERDSIYYCNPNSKFCPEYSSPSPYLGYDTLKSFVSPYLLSKYGISNVKYFKLYFNELGEIDSVYYTDYFQSLINNIVNEVHKIKWLPAKKNNKAIKSCLSLPIVYYSKDHKSLYPIIVEAVKCGAL